MPAYPKSGPVTLKTNLADYPMTRALKSGAIKSDLVTFDFCGPKVANQGFKQMVRERAFDAGELAIGTFLEARTYGKPVTLLPAVVMGRFQHGHTLRSTAKPPFGPADIEGKRIGIRSYTQTTGIWVRGIFKHEYGVDLNKVTWVCNDDGHLAEFKDPPNVERTPPGAKKVDEMLLDGEVDGAILGVENVDDPRVAPLIPNPKQAALEWYRKYNTVPVNHLFCVDSGSRRRAAGRDRRNLPHAEGDQGRDAAVARRHRLPSVRYRGAGEAARDDHGVFGRAEDHAARVHDG